MSDLMEARLKKARRELQEEIDITLVWIREMELRHPHLREKKEGGEIMDAKQLEEAIKASAPDKKSADTFEAMLASGKLIIVS